MSNWKSCVKMESGNIRTPKFRMSYPYLFSPNPRAKKTDKNGNPVDSYTLSLLIPGDCDLTLLQEAAAECAIKEHGVENIKKWKQIDKWNSPFHDAFKASKREQNPDGDEWCKGWTLIRADSRACPGVVGPNGLKTDDSSEVYPGRWAVATLSPSSYPAINSGKPGVKFWLQNVQLLDHDTVLGGGRVAASQEFAPVEGIAEGGSSDDVLGDGGSADSVLV